MAEDRPNPALHLVAPLLAFGGTFLVRKALTVGYRQFTGKSAPDPHQRATPVFTAVMWAAATAAAAAIVEVAVYRITTPD
jgi:hypothetical protein